MARRFPFFVGAAALLAILQNSAVAGDPGPTVKFTTKLGVTRTVTVATAVNATMSPNEKEGAAFSLAAKDGLRLDIPLSVVKTLTNTKDETKVVLIDGSEHVGKLVGNPRLFTQDQEDYEFVGMKSLIVSDAPLAKKLAPKLPAWTVKVHKPQEKIYPAHGPNFSTAYTKNKGGFGGPGVGGPAGLGGAGGAGFGGKGSTAAASKLNSKFGGRLALLVNGESLTGYLNDFEKIEVMKQGENWVMTVQAPLAAPVTGTLEGNNWNLRWTTPAGYAINLQSDALAGGFFLQKVTK